MKLLRNTKELEKKLKSRDYQLEVLYEFVNKVARAV
jgi:hypothetical protein